MTPTNVIVWLGIRKEQVQNFPFLKVIDVNNENFCNTIQSWRFCELIAYNSFFADGGYWVKLEILNIPWNESLLDFHTEYFDKAKILIETAVGKGYK